VSTANQPDEQSKTGSAVQRRADALRRAAQDKRRAAIKRAETAIRQLVKDKQEINFRTVARTGGVSLDFLYANSDLRQRIETLRTQQTTQPRAQNDPSHADGNIVHALTLKLREEQASRRAAIHDLENRLAAAHGEVLRLRRILQQQGVRHELSHVADASAT
jgi:Family of unknown function (DUF6262)